MTHITITDEPSKSMSANNYFYRAQNMSRSIEVDKLNSQKQLEEADLRSKVLRLTQTVNELSQFNAIVSHDLRAPLSTIVIALSLLKRDPNNIDQTILDAAHNTALRMAELISDLQQYARLDSKDYALLPVQLNQAAEVAIRNVAGNDLIKVGALPKVNGNINLLIELFQNLFENSIKYCEGKPKIEVTANIKDQLSTLSVMDNGIGISAANCTEVFKPFKRVNSGNRSIPGIGLGLCHCKRIVEIHGGQIWMEPRIGGGSTVTFSLPVAV